MLMRAPPDETPEQPPREQRDGDSWVAVASLVLFMVAVVFAVCVIASR